MDHLHQRKKVARLFPVVAPGKASVVSFRPQTQGARCRRLRAWQMQPAVPPAVNNVPLLAEPCKDWLGIGAQRPLAHCCRARLIRVCANQVAILLHSTHPYKGKVYWYFHTMHSNQIESVLHSKNTASCTGYYVLCKPVITPPRARFLRIERPSDLRVHKPWGCFWVFFFWLTCIRTCFSLYCSLYTPTSHTKVALQLASFSFQLILPLLQSARSPDPSDLLP